MNAPKQCNILRILALFSWMSLLVASIHAEPSVAVSTIPVLGDILMRVHKSVEDFWGKFGSVTCIEKVVQEKLGKQGKIEYNQKSTFDYLILLNAENNDLSVEESRLEQGNSKTKRVPLLVTSGLPILLLVFHPYYEEDFRYTLEGDEFENGRRLVRIRFQHITGMRSTTALRLRGKDYPLDIQGVASIDPETGAICRVVAGIGEPIGDFNLKALEMDVRYESYQFPTDKGRYWLPSTATINIQSERQHWRNIHHFTNYKRFTVSSEDKVLK
jgi:hypothetical protein